MAKFRYWNSALLEFIMFDNGFYSYTKSSGFNMAEPGQSLIGKKQNKNLHEMEYLFSLEILQNWMIIYMELLQ